jgi:hypothetical protein
MAGTRKGRQMNDQDMTREVSRRLRVRAMREAIAGPGDGRIGSIVKPEARELSTGVIDGSNADRDIPRFGADKLDF